MAPVTRTAALPRLSADPGETVLVLLGAGRPVRGTQPAALAAAGERGRVLDWLLHAFSNQPLDRIVFVGGYRVEEVVSRYPNISFVLNPAWYSSGTVGSLLTAPLVAGSTAYVSYTDVVYERDVATRITSAAGDVVLVSDRSWRNRFAGRPLVDIRRAEKVRVEQGHVLRIGTDLALAEASGEFIGLMKLGPRATARLAELRASSGRGWARRSLPDLIQQLIAEGFDVRAEEIDRRWAELNAPQDLARFVLGTKAATLARLQHMVRRSIVPESLRFTVAEWIAGPSRIVENIQRVMDGRNIVVRSSTSSEDSWTTSNAGAFLSVGPVASGARDAVDDAVRSVIASYNSGDPNDEVLVQEAVTGVTAAGVLMTRSPKTGAPYFVVNFDDSSGRTDTVTSGTGGALKTAYVHRASAARHELGQDVDRALAMAAEIEELVGHDTLDMEFAVLRDDRVALFQVRPIAADYGEWKAGDDDVEAALEEAERDFDRMSEPGPFIVGDAPCLAVMPDWNPAEMLGLKPRRLALTLYQHLITDEVWAQQRAELGYRDVRPSPLVLSLAGQPFVDVRASFNSFVPAVLDESAARRLVNHYLDRLRAHPELHDKVEFEIALTCMSFDFGSRAPALVDGALSRTELDELGHALAGLTAHAAADLGTHEESVRRLEKRTERIIATVADPLDRAYLLLDDCRRIGTLAFAHLARDAFIATEWLRSLVRVGVAPQETIDAFLGSLHTVAREFTDDAAGLADGRIAWEDFVTRYGHLRPGTYDITSPCYAHSMDEYIAVDAATTAENPPAGGAAPDFAEPDAFAWPAGVPDAVERRLLAAGMPMPFAAFESFVRRAIEGREYAKFAFTRNLSEALEDVALVGARYGLGREELSHLDVSDILRLRHGAATRVDEWLAERAEAGERAYRRTVAVELPAVVFRREELRAFQQSEALANFVTTETVRAPVAVIGTGPPGDTVLDGAIALIMNADPGYDWLFTRPIAGLVTAFGGANSHMAIRAAERSLPAAIGVGIRRHEILEQARVIELDCAARTVQVVM